MKSMTVTQIASAWKEYKRPYVKRSTMAAYALILENHIIPEFGKRHCLSERCVQAFVLRKVEEGLSVKSVKDILLVLKMVMMFGVKNRWTRPFQWDIHFPVHDTPPRLEVLNPADHKKILDYVRDNFNCADLGIYISLSTGMRIGEICALRWGDINLKEGIISVNRTIGRIYLVEEQHRRTELVISTPKTMKSRREIPMPEELVSMVGPLASSADPECYVLTNCRHPTEPRTYRNHYRKLMARLDIPKLKYHGLRHSFATRCIEAGCDYKTVSDILGHAKVATTLNLYVHPDLSHKKQCISQMFKALGK